MFLFRSLVVMGVSLAILLAAVTGADAAKKGKGKGKKAAKAHPVTVKNVEMAPGKTNEGSITVAEGKKKKKGAAASEAKYTVNANTKISKAGKGKGKGKKKGAQAGPATLADIHSGDKVVVIAQGGTADKIDVKKSAKGKKGKGVAKKGKGKKGKGKKKTPPAPAAAALTFEPGDQVAAVGSSDTKKAELKKKGKGKGKGKGKKGKGKKAGKGKKGKGKKSSATAANV